MDSRTRVLTALRGGEPDRVPCALGFFAQSLYGAADADEAFGTDVRFVDFAPPAGQDGFMRYLESLSPGVHIGSAAQLRAYHEWGYHPERGEDGRTGPAAGAAGAVDDGAAGAAGAVDDGAAGAARAEVRGAAGAVRIAERLAGLLPRITDRSRHAHLRAEIERHHARGLAVAGSPPHLGGELFEGAWRLRGFEIFMRDMVKRPALVDYLLDQLEAMATESARILAAAGVDVLVLDDDVAYKGGMLMSVPMWRRYFKPRMARIVGAAREAAAQAGRGTGGPLPGTGPLAPGTPSAAGVAGGRGAPPAVLYHCDGDFTAILGDLMEIGVDAVNPVAPDCMDAAGIRRALGARLALWGTVGSAWTWDQGTPEDIRGEVRRRVAEVGRAGLLLCPAYDLDFSPRANVAAFVDAVRDTK